MSHLRPHLTMVIKSWEFYVGVGAGAGVALLAALNSEVREQGVPMLLALAALGAAILAVVLACLAIITPTMDGPYRQILDAAGGVRAAMAPYLHIAAIGGAATVVAVLAAMAWPALSAPVEVVALSIAALLGVWCVAGVVGLTELTLFHAEQRAELQKAIDNAKTLHAEHLERPPADAGRQG